MELLILRIAVYLDHLHAVQEGTGNGLRGIGRSDKEHLGQINGNLHIVIPESDILLPVQHLQKGRGRIALIITAHLVDLIQKHQRIADSGLAQSLHQTAGHSAHIRLPVAPDLRLVPNASQADPNIFLVQSARHRAGNGGFPRSGRAHQTENRAVPLLRQGAHRQILQDALLHLFQAVMILIENLLRMPDIIVVL